MIITNSTFTLFFSENKQMRENFFKIEKHFDGYQRPFTLVPLPLDAPMEIPRIISTTENGHSQLTIRGNSVQLTTRYDNEYSDSISKCLEYKKNRVQQIVDAMPLIDGMPKENQKFYYSGLSIDMIYNENDGINSPVNYLNEVHIKDNISLPIEEMQCRLALVIENQFYLNIILQNKKFYNGIADERGSLAGLKNSNDALLVSIDINDRYSFNNVANYNSSSERIIHLAAIMERFVNDYLPTYIKTGEVNYVTE